MAKSDFHLTKGEIERAAELGGLEITSQSAEDFLRAHAKDVESEPFGDEDNPDMFEDESLNSLRPDLVYPPEDYSELMKAMAEIAFDDADEFAQFVEYNKERVYRAARMDDKVRELLLICFKMGVDKGSGACMNDLGAMYYMGDVFEQDYQKAAELYEMAADHDCYQSIINLGYIYEYGRIGEPDYAKAYEYYALAASLGESTEAAYKLGDMYTRGQSVPKNLHRAYQLYLRSYDLARGAVQIAQPAIRLAKMHLDFEASNYGVEYDPLRALSLFQQAEIGLRIDIKNGQTYYAKRLEEAIEGQQEARKRIEEQENILF